MEGSCFFENTIKLFNSSGIDDIGAIIGYNKENFYKYENITFFENSNWANNNILHSLFCARDFMDDDIVIAYGDIWFEKEPVEKLMLEGDDFVLGVDNHWEEYYIGRTEHPISEAENVHYNRDTLDVKDLGKNIYKSKEYEVGEFMGLMKISKNRLKDIIEEFEKLEATLLSTDKFYNAKEFQKAYLTDFIKYLISKSYNIKSSLNKQGWNEIDTVQDLQNLQSRIRDVK